MSFSQNLISKELTQQMQQWRRDIHAHPETAFEEVRTAKLVEETLLDMGLPVETGIAQTGLVAILENGAGPTIGLRADMDARSEERRVGKECRAGGGREHAKEKRRER